MFNSLRSSFKKDNIKLKFRLALFQELFTAGTWLGWAPMVLMLLDSGAMSSRCSVQDPVPCASQQVALAEIFTITASIILASSFPVGYSTDRWGPRIIASFGFFFSALGGILLGISVSNGYDDMILWSYMLLGFGNLGCHMPIFKLIGRLPLKDQPHSNTFVTTAFNLSPLYFQFLYILFSLGLPFQIVILFQIVPCFLGIFTVQWIYHGFEYNPSEPVKTSSQDVFENANSEIELVEHDAPNLEVNITPDNSDPKSIQKPGSSSDQDADADTNSQNMLYYWFSLPLSKQILTRPFLEISLYMSIHTLRRSYFLAVVEPYFSSLGPPSVSRPFIEFAGYAPIFSLLAIPIFKFLIHRIGVYRFWHFNNLTNLLYGVLILIPNLWTNAVSLVIFSIGNSQMFGIFFHNLALLFGYRNIGKTSGIASLINGSFGLLSIPLVSLSIKTWGSFWELNLILMVCTCFLFIPLMKWAKLIPIEK